MTYNSKPMTAADVLQKYQRQLDPEGDEVGVNRQALDEVLNDLEAVKAENKRLTDAIDAAPHDVMCTSVNIHCNDGIHTIYQDEAMPCNCWKAALEQSK